MHDASEVGGRFADSIFNTAGRNYKWPANKLSNAGIEFWSEVCSGGVVNFLPDDPSAV